MVHITAANHLAPPAACVTVADPVPLYRRGLVDTLTEHGYKVASVDSVRCLDLGSLDDVLVTTDRADPHWRQLRTSDPAGVPVLALVTQDQVEAHVDAVEAGATSVLPFDAAAADIVAAVDVTRTGQTVLGPATLDGLTAVRPSDEASLDDSDIQLLTMIQHGARIPDIADTLCTSSRTVQRRLHDLRERFGVPSTAGVLATAVHRGLVPDP